MVEPVRKSYLDLIRANMAMAERTQFITRLVYFGTYDGSEEDLQKKFETVVKYVESEHPGAAITGLLLVYPRYFLHIIETSEELIFRHLKAIFYDEEMSIDLGRILPLSIYHHVHHRFFPRWLKLSTKPPQLLEKLEGTGFKEVEKQLTNCLLKVYTLSEYIFTNTHGSLRAVDQVLKSLHDKERRHLPESTIIEFIINFDSSILRDLREYVDIYQMAPRIRLYNESIWPPPCDFIPHEVFVEHTSRRDLMLKRLSQRQQWHRQSE